MFQVLFSIILWINAELFSILISILCKSVHMYAIMSTYCIQQN